MTIRSVHALREAAPRVPLVARLIAAGLVSEQQLQRALQEKSRCDRPLGEILVELGLISEKVLRETLAELLDDEKIDLRVLLPEPRAVAMVPRELAEQHCILPIDLDAQAGHLTLAVSEKFDLSALDDMSRVLDSGVGIETRVAADVEIRSAIKKFYDVALTIPAILKEIDSDETGILDTAADTSACFHPIKRLINAVIFAAARRDATAIHFEPEIGFLRVRFRIDGVLHQVLALHHSYSAALAAGLKAMFDMSRCEQCCSGKARISIMLGTRRTALSLSCQPSRKGENFVLRMVAEEGHVIPLDQLGIGTRALAQLRLMLARPDGLIVVAGPADSGKTTTLFSMLNYRRDESVSIVAIEEPARYPMPLVLEATSVTGDRLHDTDRIRSCLHLDSEVLMVGELTDKPAATEALRAAMAGRQVFTRLRARSALDAVARLVEIGMKRRRMAGNISGIIAQRLLRRLCVNCRQPYWPESWERKLLGVDESNPLRLYREGACDRCTFHGYKGRIGVFEVLVVNEELDELIARNATLQEMRRSVGTSGFKGLADAALEQVLAGVTSLSEASRVVDLSARLS